jgi:hypothetical protein
MLVKHSKRHDPLGITQYVLGKPGAAVIGSTLACPDDPHAIAAEIRFSCAASKRLKLTTYHASLAVAPPERLSDALWHQVAQDYLAKMQYGLCPYLVVRHTDADHDHIHIVAGRLDLNRGKRVPDSWDHYKAETAARELEAEYDLTPTLSSWQTERKPPTVGMIRHEREAGQPAVKPELQDLIDDLSGQVDSLDEFAKRLDQAGVEMNLKPINETTVGLTYQFKGLYFSASQLGRAYTLNGLRTFRGIELPQDSAAVMAWWEGRQRGQESESTEPELAQVQDEEHGQPEPELETEFPTPAQPASQNQEPTGVDPDLKELEVQQRQAQKRKPQRRRQRHRQMER